MSGSAARRVGVRLFLLLLLVGLAIWAWFLRSEGPTQTDIGRIDPGERFAEPVRFIFAKDRDSVVVERFDDGFWVTSPVRDIANVIRLKQTVRGLLKLEAARVLPDTNRANFGLLPPGRRFTVVNAEGARWSLAFGDSSPVTSQIYAQVDGPDQPIVLLDHFSARRDFLPTLTQLRHPVPVILPSPIIDSIEVVNPLYRLRAVRHSRKLWIAQEPEGLDLDPLPINRGIGYLRQPQIRSYLEDPNPDLHALGLDPPRATWTLYQGDRVAVIRFGHPVGRGKLIYCIPAGREQVALMANNFYRDFVDGWPRLADLRLLAFDPDSVRKIEFLDSDGGYLREGNGWIRQPGGVPVKAVEALEEDLKNLSVLRYRDFPLEDHARNPGREVFAMRLETSAAAETLRLGWAAGDTLILGWGSRHHRWAPVPDLVLRLWSSRAENPEH